MPDHPILLFFVFVLSFPLYRLLAQAFYGDNFENLPEALRFIFTNDFESMKKGKFWQDWDASLKFKFFLVFCGLWALAITEIIVKIFY